MKQIQFATVQVASGPVFNADVRKQLEGPLNNGWELQDWKADFNARDANNQPIINVLVCLVRDLPDEENAKSAKKDA